MNFLRIFTSTIAISIMALGSAGAMPTLRRWTPQQAPILPVQESLALDRIKNIVADLRSPEPKLHGMEPFVQATIMNQLGIIQFRLQQLGELETVLFQGKQQGADVYRVRFQNGWTTWMIGSSPEGKVSVLWFQ